MARGTWQGTGTWKTTSGGGGGLVLLVVVAASTGSGSGRAIASALEVLLTVACVLGAAVLVTVAVVVYRVRQAAQNRESEPALGATGRYAWCPPPRLRPWRPHSRARSSRRATSCTCTSTG